MQTFRRGWWSEEAVLDDEDAAILQKLAADFQKLRAAKVEKKPVEKPVEKKPAVVQTMDNAEEEGWQDEDGVMEDGEENGTECVMV